MAKSYSYIKSTTTTKKLVGVYNAENHSISVEDDDKDLFSELRDFGGNIIEISVTTKEKTDLSNKI